MPPCASWRAPRGAWASRWCEGARQAREGREETDMATVVSKRYDAATAKVEEERQYTVDEAIGLVKELPGAKFDESVDLSFRLGVDPKHADQMVRGAVVLPHGRGRTVRVAVFAK